MAATTLRRIRECLRSRRRSPDAASRWPSGELVFAGTRVEVKTLVDYLKGGHTLDDFLDGGRTLPSSSERTTRRRNGTPADPHLRTGGLRQDHSSEPVAYHALGRAMAGWLSFDEDDNDPLRFWMYFVAALRKLHPDVAGGAMTMLRSPQTPPVERLLTPLINDISGLPRDFALVLDDYHVIEADSIHRALAFLLEHMPPQMHLVIAGRTDPPLPLARLRARGQLAELRAADLRFTTEETAAFFADVMGLSLPMEYVASLGARTEGWVAGLQLAALSRRGRPDLTRFASTFAGSNRHVVDYLTEEVLERQPEPILRLGL